MKLKRGISALVIIAVGALLTLSAFWTLNKSRHSRTRTGVLSKSGNASSARPMPSAQIPTTPMAPTAETDEAASPAATPPLTIASRDAKTLRRADIDPQLLMVRQMLRDYRAALGENPIGTNSEITKALLGANSRKSKFVIAEAKLNTSHQLVDRWDHPYFFHQLSRAHMEIRSAGADGVMWTSDDEISR
jgi:hypothetical protein